MTIALVSKSSIKGTLTTSRDAGDATVAVDEARTTEVENGTGAGQANAVYIDDFSIAASGTLSIDLSGSLADPNNNTTVFTAIKEIRVTAAAGNTNNIEVGGGSNPFIGPFKDSSDKAVVKPGGLFHINDGYSAAGWAVTAGTGDILLLANSSSGSSVAGTIVIVGEA